MFKHDFRYTCHMDSSNITTTLLVNMHQDIGGYFCSLCKLLSTTKHKKFKRTSIPKIIQHERAININNSQEIVTGDIQYMDGENNKYDFVKYIYIKANPTKQIYLGKLFQ